MTVKLPKNFDTWIIVVITVRPKIKFYLFAIAYLPPPCCVLEQDTLLPRKYWLITQEAMAPSRHDWKIVDWDVKPQHNQPKAYLPTLLPPTQLSFFFFLLFQN